MAKKKKGKKGKKGKGGGGDKVVIATTPQMVAERQRIAAANEPLGHYHCVKRRGSELRAEVATARLRKGIEVKQPRLNLRGLTLEDVPSVLAVEQPRDEWGAALPPSNNALEKHDALWKSLTAIDLSHNELFRTEDTFQRLAWLGGRIQELSLKANALGGTVPLAAGKLTGLRSLDLSDNDLTGISPEAAAGWGELETLSASRNGLVVLPATTGAWAKLARLDLHANKLVQLDGEATFAAWPALAVCNLSKNQIAMLPSTIGQCAALTAL
jgi:hypothetical protein